MLATKNGETSSTFSLQAHRVAHRSGPCHGVPLLQKCKWILTSRVNLLRPQAITAVTIRETKERVESEKEGSPPLPSIVLQALLRNQLGGRRPTANAQSSESSHRRAYMALWRLAGVGCPSALNPLSLRLPYLLQELRCPWCSRPPVGGSRQLPSWLDPEPSSRTAGALFPTGLYFRISTGTADLAPSPTRSQARSKVQQVSFQSLCTGYCHSWLPVFSSSCVHTLAYPT